MDFLKFLSRKYDFDLRDVKEEYEDLKNKVSQLKIGDTVYYWEGGEDICELKISKINCENWTITAPGWNPIPISRVSLEHPLAKFQVTAGVI